MNSLARLANSRPPLEESNTSSFFYTDDSYGRDDFVRKSNLAILQASGPHPVTRKSSQEQAALSATSLSGGDNSVVSAAIAAIGSSSPGRDTDGSFGRKKMKKVKTLQQPLIDEHDTSNS